MVYIKTKSVKWLIFVCVLCSIAAFVVFKLHNRYKPLLYTKEEVRCLYQDHTELFDTVVSVITSNERFFNEGRLDEYEPAMITSSHDEQLSLFSDSDRNILLELLQFKPYMILYDYARCFVSITFIAADNTDHCESYTLSFWTSEQEDSNIKFEYRKQYLSQDYIVENITDQCILYYTK